MLDVRCTAPLAAPLGPVVIRCAVRLRGLLSFSLSCSLFVSVVLQCKRDVAREESRAVVVRTRCVDNQTLMNLLAGSFFGCIADGQPNCRSHGGVGSASTFPPQQIIAPSASF